MDNFKIDVISKGRAHFEATLRLACDPTKGFTHYAIDRALGMLLFTERPPVGHYSFVVQPLVTKMTIAGLMNFAWEWLVTAEYPAIDPEQPAEKGFHISTGQSWEPVAGLKECYFHVEPRWIEVAGAAALATAGTVRSLLHLPSRRSP